MQCIREGHDESPFVSLQCRREAVYKGYCRSCAWVMLPDERDMLPEKVKTVKPRAEQKETPWSKRVFAPFAPWFTRKEWPVGSVLLRRNNNGLVNLPRGGKIKFGLGNGTGDFIGWQSIMITPDMVGKRFSRFVSIEAKRDSKDLEGRQRHWHEVVIENGGISMRAAPETIEDVLEALNANNPLPP